MRNYTLSLFPRQVKRYRRPYRPALLKYREDEYRLEKPLIADRIEAAGDPKLARRVRFCKERVMVFKCSGQHDATYPAEELRVPYTCKTFICPVCAWETYKAQEGKFRRMSEAIGLRPGHRLQFLTLTKKVENRELPSTDDLKRFFRQVRKLVNKFYPKKVGAGALGVFELGRGYNSHIHLLVAGPIFSRSKLAQEWKKLTGDSYIVDVCPIEKKTGSRGLRDALRYILKYIGKVRHFESYADTADFGLMLRGARRVHTFGVFYNPYTVGRTVTTKAGHTFEVLPGVLAGKKPERHRLTCEHCGGSFFFDSFDEQALWWDAESYLEMVGLH